MNAISFGWTSAALLAGRKTVTRRFWKPMHRHRFHKGGVYWALDKDYRVGGHRIAKVRLVVEPYEELYGDMPDEDYEKEGFGFYEEFPEEIPPGAPWRRMSRLTFEAMRRARATDVCVVLRLEMTEILAA
jgi:hypothetical protein